MITEISLSQLVNNTNNEFPDTNRDENSLRVRVDSYEFIPSMIGNTLQIKFNVVSTSNNGKYVSRVFFDNVKYVDENEDGAIEIFGASQGIPYYILPLQYASRDVKVTCTCLDFRFRFAQWNNGINALLGPPPPPYIRKTNTRPEVNPNKVPGMCKHLMKCIDFLRLEKIVV